MERKFQIGDRVSANEKSNGRYAVTCKRNGYVGYVIAYDDKDYFFVVCDRQDGTGAKFSVREEFFDLVPPEPIETPDGDLFSSLFS